MHTKDPVASGLRLWRHDTDLAAYQRIDQRRLADVRTPDDCHESCAESPGHSGGLVDERQHLHGRILFGPSARAAAPDCARLQCIDTATHRESLAVRLPGDALYPVMRQLQLSRLQELLQLRLGVPARSRLRELPKPVAVHLPDNPACLVETGVEVDSSEDRFESIAENGRAPVSIALLHACAQDQV